MTNEEIEIIECGLVQLLINHKQEEKRIEKILEKLKKIEVIE